MKQALFVFTFDSPDDARVVATALSPEVSQKIPKTVVHISQSEEKVSLTIESPDVRSLRAACNSYLRWIQTALNVKHIV